MEHFLHKTYNFFLKGLKSALYVVVFCLMGVMGKGQVYVNTFTGASSCPTNGNIPTMASGSSGTPATRSTITCLASANVFNSDNLNITGSISNTSYIEFSATANSGFQLNLTSLSFFRQGSASAPNQLEVRYSTDGFATFSTWGSAPNTPTSGSVITWDFVDFSTAIAGTVSFRIYPFGTTRCDFGSPSLSGGTFRIDDVTINGTVSSTNSISISSLSNNNFTLSNCTTTASVDVNFNSTGTFSAGNNFTTQLSDASGSFASPVSIGVINLSGTNPSGTITSTIPAGTLSGSNYKIRIISDNPSVTSTLSSAITVTQNGYCGTNSTDYFRSRSSGNWNTPSTWESSPNSSFSPVITATQSPTSAANTITIRSAHDVTLSANASADQLTIDQGGVLTHNNSVTFTLNNDPSGTDMIINGTYVIYGPVPSGTGTYTVENTGIIRANGNAGGTADNIARNTNTLVLFKTGSVFEWNTTLAFSTTNITYFPNNSEKPIFRITAPVGNVGSNSTTTFNGLFEVNGSIIWDNTGTKYFRDGIIVSGLISQTSACGPLIITGNQVTDRRALLRTTGSGEISLDGNGLQIGTGISIVLVELDSDILINKEPTAIPGKFNFTVNDFGQLNCNTFLVKGTSNFVLASGGTLGIGSPQGITSAGTGNIQTSTRYYSSGANYIYNANEKQSTGDFITQPTTNTVRGLSISNTGPIGNNTVTLTNDNLTASILNLYNGYFAAGAVNRNLQIANGGYVYGGDGENPNDPVAGNIVFLGTGYTTGIGSGKPKLYSVIISNGVDFNGSLPHSATIMNRLQINANGFVKDDAPFYQTGSSLIYNSDFNIYGAYKRKVEWGNTAGLQGYPHHVVVQGNTILDLNDPPTSPIPAALTELALGGDLIIGNSFGKGEVYLSNYMTKPLSVLGNLEIGKEGATGSKLQLSTEIGGDLNLYGNFTRYNGSFYEENPVGGGNGRAIFFKGIGNSTINTPGVSGFPTQEFHWFFLDKTLTAIDTPTITLNCPVAIKKRIDFKTGVVITSNPNMLIINDNASAINNTDLTNNNSFVDGPIRKIGTQPFVFPTGKIGWGRRTIGISNPTGSTDAFTAEFFRTDSYTRGIISTTAKTNGLQRISRCENWGLVRNSGSTNVDVTLSWTDRSPCNTSLYVTKPSTVVAVQFNGLQWGDLFGGSGSGTNTRGTVTWSGANIYNYFTLGSTDFLENPLPFELSSFTARSRKSDIQIDWNVMNNNDQDEYILEHSKDGIQFTTLKVVKAKVILNKAAYTELDQNPYNGWNYYRLRAKDKLDREKVSQVVKVWFGFADVIRISPNPASEKININLAEPSSINQIQLVNSTGQVLKQVSNIQFSNEINISELAAGVYYLRLTGKNGLTIKSFVKN